MSRPNTQIPLDHDNSTDPKLNVSCLDFLLIELVPLAQRITDQLHAREAALVEEFRKSKIFNHASTTAQQQQQQTLTPAVTVTESGTGQRGTAEKNGAGTVTTSGVGATSTIGGAPNMDTETQQAVFWRLDNLGYRVGQGLVERFSVNKPRPTTPLEAIKFICKDLWTLLFRKQIDNLKTNHRGVFVLTDSRFVPISRMSVDRRAGAKGAEDALKRAQSYLYFPCGVIRGALAGLGLEVTITAETTEIPAATFQIKTKGAKA